MNRAIGVYGYGGFGREVLPLVNRQLQAEGDQEDAVYFIDDAEGAEEVNGVPVVDFDTFRALPAASHAVSIAVADGKIRRTLSDRCREAGVALLGVRAANVEVLGETEVGPGEILCSFVTLTSDLKIGTSFHANLYSYVAHDCVIGDYVTFAPRVHCNGNVVIEDEVYVGTGAIIKQGRPGRPLRIGKGAVISAGAFVTKNVPPGMTVFGNPAIEMTRENLRRRNG